MNQTMYTVHGNSAHQRQQPLPPPLAVPPRLHPQNIPFAPIMSSPTSYPPPSPAEPSPSSGKSKEEDYAERPGPPPVSTVYEGRIWALDVVQQPVRARMCGFGDKDRRPITPPPCVRLIVMNRETHQEIDASQIDTSFFVLTVDLWDVEGTKEVNLVKHAANSPSISTAATSSYPPTSTSSSPAQPRPYPPSNIPQYQGQTYSSPVAPNYTQAMAPQFPTNGLPQGYGHPPPPPTLPNPGYGQPLIPQHAYAWSTNYAPHQGHHKSNGYPYASQPHSPWPPESFPNSAMSARYQQIRPEPLNGANGMFTRNLIGSLSASAFKLTDEKDRIGIWFILQDLSVRTEGWFRLKMNFVNVGQAAAHPPITPASTSVHGLAPPQDICKTTAPVLATIFSKPFQVFSAKKFPGVIESTELSRAFAGQGIKIPIRKDPAPTGKGVRRRRSADEDEEDEDEE